MPVTHVCHAFTAEGIDHVLLGHLFHGFLPFFKSILARLTL
jgi:hypothetical protein